MYPQEKKAVKKLLVITLLLIQLKVVWFLDARSNLASVLTRAQLASPNRTG